MEKRFLVPALFACISVSTNAYAQGMGASRALCPIEMQQAGDGSTQLVNMCDPLYPVKPLPPDPVEPLDCPYVLPVPADEMSVSCKAQENITRCGQGLPYDLCASFNTSSYNAGLLTATAYNWLTNNGFCAVNALPGYAAIVSICPVGCFEENAEILTLNDQGTGEWLAAKLVSMQHRLFSLKADALLSSPQLSSRSIERMTAGPEEPELYVFAMSNGRKLRVTSHHAMVLADGRIVEAEKVTEGDSFVGIDGSDVTIESITREVTSADVYNFAVSAGTPQEHVIAAEGVLVGDLAWQSTLAGEMKSIQLRR